MQQIDPAIREKNRERHLQRLRLMPRRRLSRLAQEDMKRRYTPIEKRNRIVERVNDDVSPIDRMQRTHL